MIKYLQNFDEEEAKVYLEKCGEDSEFEFKKIKNFNPLLLETAMRVPKRSDLKMFYRLEVKSAVNRILTKLVVSTFEIPQDMVKIKYFAELLDKTDFF